MVLNLDNDESKRVAESCYRTRSTMLNPIIDWSDDDVWEFLKANNCQSNPLYKHFKRIGCLICPLGGRCAMKREASQYPKYKKAYIRAFEKMLRKREEDGLANPNWKTGEHVYRWWVGDDPMQMTIDDYLKMKEEQDEIMSDYGFDKEYRME